MIDFTELRAPIRIGKEPPPIVSPQDATRAFEFSIRRIVKGIEAPIRFGQYWIRTPSHLFAMAGGEEFSTIWVPDDPRGRMVSGRIRAEEGQEALFAAMTKFGLDTRVTEEFKGGIVINPYASDLRDVWSRILSFPSQTIPGLSFQQSIGYMLRTEELVYVSWQVADKAPENAINWRKIFPPLRLLQPATR